MKRTGSSKLFNSAKEHIPGGVNSPVRAFGSVGGEPVFMRNAKGAWLYDVDGNAYVDFINSWGPMILGHAHPMVLEKVTEKLGQGFSFGTPTELETELVLQVKKMVPGLEQLRLVSSGTEACMSAVRLARGYTGRKKIIKFSGCYHGHADAFLAKAGSGMMSFSISGSAGVPDAVVADTLLATYNDTEGVKALFREQGEEIAAVIVEPVAGNMGCIPPLSGFLQILRSCCTEYGSVLIFDEVMTGFRLAQGGAQEWSGIQADLVTYGKVIGGGMPVGAFGGKKHIMQMLAPLGPVYQAGTLSGNPVSVSCGLATLQLLASQPEIYSRIDQTRQTIQELLYSHFNGKGTFVINSCHSMISIHFGTERIQNYEDALAAENKTFNRFFHHMLDRGVYLPPSAFESWFISQAISERELEAFEKALRSFEY